MRISNFVPLALALLTASSAACYRASAPETASMPETEIRGIEWLLVELNGATAPKGMGEKPATLNLSREGRLASGFAGCNRVSGQYVLQGDSLKIGPLVMTRMACTEGMGLEQQYAKALEATRRYRVTDGVLALIVGDTVVARLEQE